MSCWQVKTGERRDLAFAACLIARRVMTVAASASHALAVRKAGSTTHDD